MDKCQFNLCTSTTRIVSGLCLGHYAQRARGEELRSLRERVTKSPKRSPEQIRQRNEFGEKWCLYCAAWHPESDFSPRADSPDGLMGWCRATKSTRVRLKMKGISQERFDSMMIEQGGSCAICFKALTPPTANIDHDHSCCPGKRSCGKCVRGLLCQGCNYGIGHFADSITNMQSAIDYLRGRVG